METREIEAKYYIQDLASIAAHLQQSGARIIQPRTFERNLRFDTPSGGLKKQGCILRLRQDEHIHITYKGAPHRTAGVSSRAEVEFTVSDFEAAQALLEALGYIVFAVYEKYRTTFQLGEFHIMLDELPYGHFVEIEGPDPASVQRLAHDLGLDPAKAADTSYLEIFDRLCQRRGLNPSQLTFASLQGLSILPQELGLMAADQ